VNTVVDKLLDVARQAKQIVDEARAYYEKTTEEIGNERERIFDVYIQKADKQLSDLRNSEKAAVDEAVSKINKESSALASRMEKIYTNRHKEWEDAMYIACIKQGDQP
jgi:vacuolar-type H+-ATPase subunit E/Vma4